MALVPEPRARLHARIAERFNRMMAQGFLEEVRALHGRGDLTAGHASMRAVGYRQLWQHCEGQSSLGQAIAQGVAATRQLAKRQLTWLRADDSVRLVDPQAPGAFRRMELGGGRGTEWLYPLIGARGRMCLTPCCARGRACLLTGGFRNRGCPAEPNN